MQTLTEHFIFVNHKEKDKPMNAKESSHMSPVKYDKQGH